MIPPPSDEFSEWARETIGLNPQSQADRNWVNTNVNAARSAVQAHAFVNDVQEYIASHKATNQVSEVNITSRDFAIYTKSFDSIISKLFRFNVLENTNFPNEHASGWISARNIFDRINDLTRTVVTCRYFNEPQQIAEALAAIAELHHLPVRIKAQARDVGYYAYHVYVTFPITLVDQKWGEFNASVQFEIQVTTEMQYMLYELTHNFYEGERHLKHNGGDEWKWSHRSPRFVASYISHSLHLLEGLIMQLYESNDQKIDRSTTPLSADDGQSMNESTE